MIVDEPHVDVTGSGALCLEFLNTIACREPEPLNEWLTSYAALASWARRTGVLSEPESLHLQREADARPEEAAAVLARAIALREALYRTLLGRLRGVEPDVGDLDLLNQEIGEAMDRRRVEPDGDGFHWSWRAAGELDRILWPVAYSAAELLTSGELERLRQCAGDRCDWMFLDRSRNRSRRWCDMRDCGNRAKVRRHYQRRRATVGLPG